MGKFEEHHDICEELFITQGKTLAQIQAETQVSQMTLKKWKDSGEWEKKKTEYTENNQTLKSILEEIKLKLANEVLKQLKAGNIDAQKLYALSRMISATSGKKFSDETPEESKESPSKEKGLSQDMAEEIRNILRGGINDG